MYKIRQLVPALLLATISLCTNLTAKAQQAAKGVKNIVLVHGAFADGSSWAKIIPALKAQGYNVIAVQNPTTSLADDVDATKRAIALLDGPVLLVGHSYGGIVISEAGNDPKVAGLLYVCALIPDDEEAVSDVVKPFAPAPGSGEFRPDAFGFLTLSNKGIHNYFAQDLSAREKDILYATQTPWAVKATTDKITHPAWKEKRSWAIIGLNDNMVPVPLARAVTARAKATTIELKSSHVPMLSMPAKVVAYITEAAKAL